MDGSASSKKRVNPRPPRNTLFIVGLGIRSPAHLTQEAIAALRCCEAIYTIAPEQRWPLLKESAGCSLPLVSQRHHYKAGKDRRASYRELVTEVLKGADESTSPTAWLTYGHPLVFDSVSTKLLEEGRRAGMEVTVLPGISCIDSILVDLEVDPADGLLVLDASRAIGTAATLQPELGTLFLQVNAVLSEEVRLLGDPVPPLEPLQKYLRRFYEPGHRAILVRSSTNEGSPSQLTHTTVEGLDREVVAKSDGASLFLPAG
jgi:Tetrapyrrole (Corrin/Porphyrin) Methylases